MPQFLIMNQRQKTTGLMAWFSFYIVLLGLITYYYVLNEFSNPMSDYCGHVYSYIPLLQGGSAEGWMSIPYFLWHSVTITLYRIVRIPMEPSAALSSVLFAALSFSVLFYMIYAYCKAKKIDIAPFAVVTLAFALCIIQRIILPWTDIAGDFTINPLHNPTQMCVKPFSLLCFAITYDIFEKLKNPEYEGTFLSMKKGLLPAYLSLATVLFLSGMAKPTFAEMFIPTVGLLMLFEWTSRLIRKDGSAKTYFIELCKMFLVAVPTIAYIFLQFLAYFVWGGSYGMEESHMVITRFMEVWSLFSENIPLSIALSLGFPLFILMLDFRFFLKDNLGRISLMGYIVSLLEAGFLTEESKMGHGDFLWPMMSGMLLLWVTATLRFLAMCNNPDRKPLTICIGQILYSIFALTGMLNIIVVLFNL